MAKRKIVRIPGVLVAGSPSMVSSLTGSNRVLKVPGEHSTAFPHRDNHYMLVVIDRGSSVEILILRKSRQRPFLHVCVSQAGASACTMNAHGWLDRLILIRLWLICNYERPGHNV